MLISFSGSHSTGKSTLLAECKRHYPQFTYVEEVTRKVLREHNFVKINEGTNNISQILVLNETFENHIMPFEGTKIMDRCILDTVIYTNYFVGIEAVDKWVFDYSIKLFDLLFPKLDIIFYPNPYEVLLVDDGERSINQDFRDAIIASFEGWMKLPRVAQKIVQLNGTVEQRMQTIKNTLK